jgi:hypothetical protein
MIEQIALSAGFRKGSPMIGSNDWIAANRRVSATDSESTLLPMLIAGLVAVVIGITIAAFFV